MSERLVPIPTDPLTGLARPIYITRDHFEDGDPYGPETHFHHQNFPNCRKELQDLAGKVLKYSYGERLPEIMHYNVYPGSVHYFFDGPNLPQGVVQKTNMAILAIAGARPRNAIELNEDGYRDRLLTDEEHEFISRITGIEDGHKTRRAIFRKHRMGKFFIKHSLEQGGAELFSQREMSRFLRAKLNMDHARTRELGNLMIHRAVGEMIASVQPTYDAAKEQGMVSAVKPGLTASVHKFLPAHLFGEYYDDIQATIERDLELEGAVLLAA
ncbi:MAG: hypothetical protein JWO96_71 [Candidatus Saccharibacteria bacterium]|nr:hypothetical protein [Candidatus Saccharibacteria bacterium]